MAARIGHQPSGRSALSVIRRHPRALGSDGGRGTSPSGHASRTIATFLMNRPPESELVEWRLRLFCGHVVTRRSHHTNTTVHMAVTGNVPSNGGHDELVAVLVDAGADVNARDRQGSTALMSAAQHGNPRSVKRLLVAGADATARRDGDGLTALDFAVMNGRERAADILRSVSGAG